MLIHQRRLPTSTKTSAGLKLRASRRPVVKPLQAQNSGFEVLEAFHYGRALATVISTRLGEAFSDVISEVSTVIAERDARLKELQDEVVALAQKEMYGGEVPAAVTAASNASTPSSITTTTVPLDVEAIVDDLRAEIASSRAVLQQIRAAKP